MVTVVCNKISYRVYAHAMAVTMIAMLALLVRVYLDKCDLEDRLDALHAEMANSEPSQPMPAQVTVPKLTEELIGESLAFKNKNLLNIKSPKSGGRWKGQIGEDKFGHAVFSDWEYGIRAACFVLKNYAKRHKIATIEALVYRFCTGNREAYIAYICTNLKVTPEQKIDLISYIPELLRHMAVFESGKREGLPERLFVAYDVLSHI